MLAALVAAAALLAPLDAAGQQSAEPNNPYEARQRSYARDVERLGRSPRGIVPLLRLFGHAEDARPEVTRELLGRLSQSRRLTPALRAYAGTLHAQTLLWGGDPDGAARAYRELGYLESFRVIGPFDNEGKAGFGREQPVQAARNAPVDLDTPHLGSERQVQWRTLPDEHRFGWVDLSAFLRPGVNVCGFAETFVRSERATPASVWVGSAGAVAVWVNGEEVLRDEVVRGGDYDRHAAAVALRRGDNRVLVKVCVEEGAWGFSIRLGDRNGSPMAGLTVDPTGATEAAPAPTRPVRLGRPPTSFLAALEARVAQRPDDAQALHELALFLSATAADDPAEEDARQHAEHACEVSPSVERCLLAAVLVEQRAEVMRFVSAAEAADADHPSVRLTAALMAATGPDSERAFRLLDGVPAGTQEALSARGTRASMLASLGMLESAHTELTAALSEAGDAPRWLSRYIESVAALGRADEVFALHARFLNVRWDDAGTRRILINDALRRGETELVEQHLTAMRAATADDASFHYYAASVYDGLGREADAIGEYRAALALSPDESSAHVALGRALLRFGQRDAAAASLRHALALRPQDADTRDLLEDIRPTERPDEALATSTAEVLRRRGAGEGWSATVLHDLRVASVHDNGLGSTFRQLVVQVHDDQAADRYRAHSIRYEPSSQWVDVRLARVYRADGSVRESVGQRSRSLADHRYRIYYDTRALVVQFPDLSPGDTIELRYRVDDVAARNEFADYFGDLQILGGFDPIERLEYVLRTPTSRELFFNEPQMEGLSHDRRFGSGLRIDRFVATNVPALRAEPGMPGITEVAPYLHVSTYRTWEDVGRWWWGLVQDQLVPDADLRRTVSALVDGVTDTREKVKRIYHWVVENTRYVGLEFGIHGFKPYRVTQVVRRGFGDCKDKASLLYAMLTLAGVEARIALTRTRRNGNITDAPASLAIFDHAIAYVPELDLFLDGTAEYSGTGELPGGDQGVTVLVVGPNDARLARTPELPADRQRRSRELMISLSSDGSAEVDGDEVVASPSAGGYRSTYQAEHTQSARLQRSLSGVFPGIEIVETRFEGLDDFEAPVRYHYRARVPQMAQRSDAGLRVAPSSLSELTRDLARTPTRRHPLDLGTRSSYSERRTIRPSTGMRLDQVPAGGEVTSPFGRLAVRYERAGANVTATTELVLDRSRIAPGEYEAFRDFTRRADQLLRQRVSLTGGQ